jgi:peptide/nickel transport system permease protein
VARDLARFVARRLMSLVVVVAGIAVISFLVERVIPADPAQQIAGLGATPQAIEQVRQRLGLDQPLTTQFVTYMNGLLHLNFGDSFVTGQPVMSDIASRLPATLELAFVSFALYVAASFVLGTIAAAGSSRVQQNLIRILTLAGSSIPPYWLALVLQIVFYYWLGWFPAGGQLPVGDIPDPHVTGFYLIDAIIARDPGTFWATLYCLVLPSVSLALMNVGSLTRLIRAQVMDELKSDYVTAARARGIGRWAVLRSHVLPNAINPVITVTGMQLGFLIGGTIYIEKIFQWPGLGSYTWDSVVALDFPAITAVAIVLSAVFVAVGLIVDVLHFLLDPRVRVGTE